MMLFSPPREVMDRVHSVVNNKLEGLPFEAAFVDGIQTGRKTWMEVYLRGKEDTAVIDTHEWSGLRDRVTADLQDEFDQLYDEFIPDPPV